MKAVIRRRTRRAVAGSARLWQASPLTYVVLIFGIVLSAFPLYWMFVVATRTNEVVGAVPPPFIAGQHLGANMRRLFDNEQAHFAKALVNSAIASAVVAISTVFFASLAGFAFAKLRFRGSNILLAVCIATMMVPLQMGVIPLYMMMARIGLAGHLSAVILPGLCTAFGVFFMRQYIVSAVPDELIEAAYMDGAGPFRVLLSVVVPSVRPAMAVLGMLTFLMAWNDFFWPIIVLSSQNPTVQVSFQSLATGYAPQQSIVMAGTLYGTIPVLIVFALLGRQIVGGIMQGAVKG
jgi:cellobiose transport system permease protein